MSAVRTAKSAAAVFAFALATTGTVVAYHGSHSATAPVATTTNSPYPSPSATAIAGPTQSPSAAPTAAQTALPTAAPTTPQTPRPTVAPTPRHSPTPTPPTGPGPCTTANLLTSTDYLINGHSLETTTFHSGDVVMLWPNTENTSTAQCTMPAVVERVYVTGPAGTSIFGLPANGLMAEQTFAAQMVDPIDWLGDGPDAHPGTTAADVGLSMTVNWPIWCSAATPRTCQAGVDGKYTIRFDVDNQATGAVIASTQAWFLYSSQANPTPTLAP